jgi:3-dehydroquinate synthase
VKVSTLKIVLFVIFVMTLVCLPFVLFGEEYVLPLLESPEQRVWALVAIAIGLLASDSVAPVPATLVIMYLAAKAGVMAGVIAGTIGLTLGVLAAAWIGRAAVGRLAPRFLPDAELVRMRESLQRRLMITLACLRSVPVLAETSVIVAAATGISVARIVRVTLLPNFVMSVIYSVAADDSLVTAAVTFAATMLFSYVSWRIVTRREATAAQLAVETSKREELESKP